MGELRVYLVTGVSRGIGKAIVEELMADGHDKVVYGIARSSDALKELKEKFGDRFEYTVADVCDEEKINLLLQAIESKHDRLDAIIANAGVLEPVQGVNNINVDCWKHLFDVNFFAIVKLVSLSIKLVSKSKGNLIFVSSGASVKPYNGWGAYGASKAALNHFAMTIAQDEPSVKTIAVAPGVVDTQMQTEIRENLGPKGMTKEALKRFIDLKSGGQLLDVKIPAKVYSSLAMNGIPDELNGKYVRYNDERLSLDS